MVDVEDQAWLRYDQHLSACLFSVSKNRIDADKDWQVDEHRVYACVSLSCLPQRLTARVKEILHLASINCSALFISHSTKQVTPAQTINTVPLLDPKT